MSRLLLVSFQQAVRSITLALLPIAFASLLVWATAGSSNGNTADPLRAALWLFLAAHHVPLQLSLSNATFSGMLGFLPLGALVVPYLTAKSGYNRMVEILGVPDQRTKRLYILDYSISYAVVTYLIALPTMGSTVYSPFYIAIPIIFIVSAVFAYIVSGVLPAHGSRLPWQRALRFIWISLTFLIGLSSIMVAASMTFHFTTVAKLTEVIAPGIIGGIAFFLIQFFYLPNIAVAALSYLSGAGIRIGSGTHISPYIHRIDEIPAIPLLGALPVQTHLWLGILAAFPIAMGFVMAQYSIRTFTDLIEIKRFLLSAHVFLFTLSMVLALFAGGELLSSNLNFVGPLWRLMPLALTLESVIGVGICIGIPMLITRIRNARATS